MSAERWQFWVDRGGTFTDVIARKPDGAMLTHKVLSENPERYRDAALQGIRELLGLGPGAMRHSGREARSRQNGHHGGHQRPAGAQGRKTVLVITRGFADALRIGYQTRPDIFALDIQLPEQLYGHVIEVDERIQADGTVLKAPDEEPVRAGCRRPWRTRLPGLRHRLHARLPLHGARAPRGGPGPPCGLHPGQRLP
jgi:5-oxoprolinase (ATP-hydrolysing)